MRASGLMVLVALAGAAQAEPAWVTRAETLLATPGQAGTARAGLEALPLATRETVEWHVERARVAQGMDDAAGGAEALAVATLLVPGAGATPAAGPAVVSVRAWLATRGGQLAARAFAQVAVNPDAAARLFVAAVKADGVVLAGEDRGLRERGLALLKGDAAAAPGRAAGWWELAWYQYFTGDVASARQSFARSRAVETDAYRQWLCERWVERIDREVSQMRRADRESDERAARARAAEDARRAVEDRAAAERRAKQKEAADRADREAAKTRLRDVNARIHALDRSIATLRERERIDFARSGLPPEEAYRFFEELKEQEKAEREEKQKLEAEKAELEANR